MNATKGNHGAHPGEASGDRDARAVQPGAYRAVESATRDRSDRATRIAWLLLVVAVVWLGIELAPEILDPPPAFNDHTLHLALVREASAALARGQDPTDFWFAPITEGYPLFRHYQHLPHVAMAGLYHLLGGAVPLETIFHVSMWLLLLAFPLSVAWSVARLCGDRRAGIFAGLAAAVLSTDHLFGFDLSSYGWAGSGMTSQLWGMVLLGPAWAVTHGALTGGRRLWLAAGLIAMLLVTHTVLGYVAALSLPVLLVAGGGPGFRVRMVRALVIAAVAGAAAAYFVVPFFLDRAAMNRSAWETASKYDSFGAATVLGWFLGGELFDHGLGASRVALITLLAGLGLLVSLLAYRARPTARPLVLLLGAWLLLYFGRPTWGVLLDALPFGRNLHLHRLIAPVHLAGVGLAGVGLARLWQALLPEPREWRPLLALAGLTALLFWPAVAERHAYIAYRLGWRETTRQAFDQDQGQLDALLQDIAARPPGRAFAGLAPSTCWGSEYKLGHVPVHALLTRAGLDSVGYLYHALSLNAEVQGYFDESRLAHFNLFNVRYVVAPLDRRFPDFVRPVATRGTHVLHTVETSGYFDLVDVPVAFQGSREAWFPAVYDWLASPLVEARCHPAFFVDRPPDSRWPWARPFAEASAGYPELARSVPAGPRGTLANERVVRPGRYEVDAKVERPCHLLLKATYHPGWRATVDGQPIAPVMVAPAFVAVPLAPGQHHVVLEYRPGAFRLILLVLGLLVLGLAALAERRGIGPWLDRLASRLPVLSRPRLLQLGVLASLLGLALLAGRSLFQLKLMSGHDTFEYLPRAVEFHRNLEAGVWLPRWAPDLGGGYGYPFFVFNPPLFYYLASFFHGLGAGLVAAQNLACALILVAGGLGMYAWTARVFGRAPAVAAAAAYLFAPYLLTDLYVRHALAELTALAVVPWALFFLHGTVRDPRFRFVVGLATSVALLLLTHNPAALILMPALVLYALVLAVGSGPRWRSGLVRAGSGIPAGLALSAFFWLPALWEKSFVKVGDLLHGYLHYGNHFVEPGQLVFSPWGYGLSVAGPDDGMSFSVGPVHLALLATAVLLWFWRRRRARGPGGQPVPGDQTRHLLLAGLLVAVTVVMATPLSRPLWDRVRLLQYMEFPGRFLLLAAVPTPVFAAFVVARAPRRWQGALAVVVVAGLLVFHLPLARPASFLAVNEADYGPAAIAAKNLAVTTRREYEPVWVETPPPVPAPGRLLLQEGRMRLLEQQVTPFGSEQTLEAAVPSTIAVSTFYFPGWEVTVDGVRQAVEPSTPSGLITFSLEPGVHRVAIRFANTTVRTVAVWLSVLALLGLAGAGVLILRVGRFAILRVGRFAP